MDNDNTTRRPRSGTRTSKAAMDAEARREAQKKQKKKSRTPRRHNKRLWKNLLIMLAVTAAVILSLMIFFKIRNINVTGNVYYTAEQITQASGIEVGDNLLALNKATVASRIMTALPYVKEVQIRRSLPNNVVIAVKEYNVSYAVKDEAGNNWLVTAAGGVLEQVDEKTAETHMTLTGFTIADPKAGESLTLTAAEGATESQLKTQREAITTLLTLLEQSDIADQIVSADIPSSYNISFWYGDQYHVLLGSTDDMEYKLQYLEEVIAQLDDYRTGEIDLTFTSEKKAIFRSFD